MAQSIYKLAQYKWTEAFYKLTKEEQGQLTAKVQASLKNVGGEVICNFAQVWSNEEYLAFMVEKYPSIEAVQMHAMTLYQLDWFNYVESKTTLGIEMPAM